MKTVSEPTGDVPGALEKAVFWLAGLRPEDLIVVTKVSCLECGCFHKLESFLWLSL